MKDILKQKIETLLAPEDYFRDVSLKNHCHFKIGGNTPYLIMPQTIEKYQAILEMFHRESAPYFVMGNGTNLLVADEGVDFPILKIGQNLSQIQVRGARIKAQAGALLSTVAKMALAKGLSGLEFAGGIPGSIGGAVAMNAGAYGGEIAQVLESATCLDSKGNEHIFSGEEMDFSYRNSKVLREGWMVSEATFLLQPKDPKEIEALMKALDQKRIEKQPLHLPSAGSVFKRPEGSYASLLIQEAGLKGLQIGRAQVSDLHCGFIVNLGGATAGDVKSLIEVIQKTVKDRFDICLETEIRLLGF